MMTKCTDLPQVYLATQLLFLHTNPNQAGLCLGVSVSSASNDFKQGWAFDVIALTANIRRCLGGIEMVHPLKVKHEPMYFANLV